MERIKIVNDLNKFALTNDDSILIEDLNYLLMDKENNIDLIYMIIVSAQLFGFSQYITDFDLNKYTNQERLLMLMETYKAEQFKYLNSGQLQLLDEIDKQSKILIAAPTSFGKTSLVNEYLIRNRAKFNNVIYVVPTNSLIEELFYKFLKFNKEYKLEYKVSTMPMLSYGYNNLLLLTPERFLIFCSNNKINDINMVVMDESYKIIDNNERNNDIVNNRSLKFRKCMEIIGSSNTKSIFLTPYTYKLTSSMISFAKKYNITFIPLKKEYVNHTLISLHGKTEYKQYFLTDDCPYNSGDNIPKKVSSILNQLVGKQNIVYISSVSDSYKIIDMYNSSFSVLNTEKINIFLNHLKTNYTADNLTIWHVIRGLEKGIGIYISSIPRYIKREIVHLYNEKVIQTLIVTTSFVEGVNSNAENIIISSRYTARNQHLNKIDLLNIMGRAGRFGSAPIGNILAINKEIYNALNDAKNSEISFSNPNYETLPSGIRNDYEIEMIEPKYLNDKEKEKLINLDNMLSIYGLNREDFNNSLNVPKSWSFKLFEFFQEQDEKTLVNYKYAIDNIMNDNTGMVANSIEEVFVALKLAFSDEEIDIFPTNYEDIKPFSKNNKFVWKTLYMLHSSFSIKNILYNKKEYLTKELENLLSKYEISTKKELEENLLLQDDDKKWIIKYLNSNLEINDNLVYNETFKFISNVMQYKIPFYLNFFITIYKMFIEKSHRYEIDVSDIDPYRISSFFENGNIDIIDKNMIDYGIPNDMIKIITDNDLSINKNTDVDSIEKFDEYQKIILKEYIELVYNI